MICSVRSLGLTGVSGYQVTAECFISNGLPAFEIVGLPDAAVKESRERVRAAAKSSGFRFPVSRITVNLAPAGMKKTGTLYDLPILLGLNNLLSCIRQTFCCNNIQAAVSQFLRADHAGHRLPNDLLVQAASSMYSASQRY